MKRFLKNYWISKNSLAALARRRHLRWAELVCVKKKAFRFQNIVIPKPIKCTWVNRCFFAYPKKLVNCCAAIYFLSFGTYGTKKAAEKRPIFSLYLALIPYNKAAPALSRSVIIFALKKTRYLKTEKVFRHPVFFANITPARAAHFYTSSG